MQVTLANPVEHSAVSTAFSLRVESAKFKLSRASEDEFASIWVEAPCVSLSRSATRASVSARDAPATYGTGGPFDQLQTAREHVVGGAPAGEVPDSGAQSQSITVCRSNGITTADDQFARRKNRAVAAHSQSVQLQKNLSRRVTREAS